MNLKEDLDFKAYVETSALEINKSENDGFSKIFGAHEAF